ncbi:MAG: CHAT domain-containing protein [Flavobacteriaceae bacterium]
MKKILLVALLCFIHFTSSAQENEISLAKIYMDSVKVNFQSNKFDKAIKWSKKALQIYQNNKNVDTLTILANNKVAESFLYKRELDSCYFYANKSLEKLKTTKVFSGSSMTYRLLSIIAYYRGKYQESLDLSKKALELSISFFGELDEESIRQCADLAHLFYTLNKYDKAIYYNKKAIRNSLIIKQESNELLSRSYIGLANTYMILGRIKEAIKYHEKSLGLIKEILGDKNEQVGGIYINLGNCYSKLGDNDKALDYYKRGETIFLNTRLRSRNILAKTYKNIGNIFRKKQEHQKSLEYFKKANTVFTEILRPNHPNIADSYMLIAVAYKYLKDYEKSSTYYHKAIDIQKLSKASYKDLAKTYHNLGIMCIENLEFNKGLNYIEKSLQMHLNILGNKSPELITLYQSLGITYRNENLHAKAIQNFEKALKLTKELKEGDNKINKVSLYIDLTSVYLKTQNLKIANKYLEQIAVLLKDYKESNLDKTYHKNYFRLKSKYYKLKLKETNKSIYIDSIKLINETSLNLQDYWYKELSTSNAREIRMKQSLPIYENSINHLITHYNTFDELEKTFEIAEKTKSLQLNESFKDSRAKHFGRVPDSLISKEYSLNIDITYYDKKIYEAQHQKEKIHDSLISIYENKLFKLKQTEYKLQETFKRDYPNYYQLKYNNDVVSVSEVQNLLKKDETLVEYFDGENSIFIYTISKNKFHVKKIDKDFPLKLWISQMRNGVYKYGSKSELYVKNAYNLYDKLIKPVEDKLNSKLIIIPDGVLNYIPFDALLYEKLSNIKSYKKLPYLIKKHQISYNYSATLYRELLEKKSIKLKKNLLAFAPDFKTDKQIAEKRDDLGYLKFNEPEVININKLIDGDIFLKQEATELNFLKHASDYKIIHLSTHSKLNDKRGDYSFIAFKKVNDSIEDDNRLYVKEVYNIPLNADMVVLSACETGLGELRRGEGVISLARAFTYAGAKSTITSLWNVNDSQTKILMELFYENIKKGMYKDEALHKAKLSYINQDYNVAPYFWACFISAGNMTPIKLENNSFSYWMILLISILVLIIFLLKKGKNRYKIN